MVNEALGNIIKMTPFKTGISLLAFTLLAACELPRGAAIESEVLSAQQGEPADFAVEPVSRDNIDRIAAWPATGWHGHYHWFNATRGSSSLRIKPGDELALTIWDSSENSLLIGAGLRQTEIQELIVSPSGTVFVPYIGDLVVSGMTQSQARKAIQSELEEISNSAQVQLLLTQGPNSSVDVIGGVETPGSYPLENQNTSLLSLLAKAGGVDPALRNPLAQLTRAGKTYQIPVTSLLAKPNRNVILRGNDQIVFLPDDRYFVALGATGTEAQVFFPQEHVSAIEALSLIGGLNDARGNPKGVLILREYPENAVKPNGPLNARTIFTLDLTTADGLFAARNFNINPQDIVLATESPVNSAQTILGLMGSALGVGRGLR